MAVAAPLPRYQHYIGGRSVAPAGGEYIETEDPYTGAVWATVARGDRRDAEAAVDAAARAPSSRAPGLP